MWSFVPPLPRKLLPKYLMCSAFAFCITVLCCGEYWYLSLIACFHNETTCEWETSALPRPGSESAENQLACSDNSTDLENATTTTPSAPVSSQGKHLCLPTTINYDIWLVNGVPSLQDYYRFEHQFSFEDHDIFEMYLVFCLLYFFLSIIFHVSLSLLAIIFFLVQGLAEVTDPFDLLMKRKLLTLGY
ncbi:unnamed protein product [Dibothriocephalus latus]|uniref:Uncharacterized protein n=1 Tax=Dibothriocephalus latus TaxID=60516 RepID=A0A3P7RR26_DIBLA|nr:unnamed protein product [Dibothriocephalus latus]